MAYLDEITLKLVSELIKSDMDGGDDNVCKAIEDLIKDSKEEGISETIFKLRRDGLLNREVAAGRLGLNVEEYSKREDKFFSQQTGI